ncbi:hypothetical protein AMECASPLE_038775 [Ameca splendens]|uniref:C-type lectin domain-containing protein n=1 Tax=Ameca splendens TaxID=208324 RepID=A0ABV0XXM2_9TELE
MLIIFSAYMMKTECQLCPKDWIVLQEKCYLFYNKSVPWRTWEESREYCLNLDSDLVVIDTLHEQEFICNHTKFYYDKWHGYWMGLQQINNNWIWLDGHNDSLR